MTMTRTRRLAYITVAFALGALAAFSGEASAQTYVGDAGGAYFYADTNYHGQYELAYGHGCKNLASPQTASSVRPVAPLFASPQVPWKKMTLWTGLGCTGTAVIITNDVPNLAEIGLDNNVAAASFR